MYNTNIQFDIIPHQNIATTQYQLKT